MKPSMFSSTETIALSLYSNRFVQAANHPHHQCTLAYFSHDLWLRLVEQEDTQNKSFDRYGSDIVMYNSVSHFTGNDRDVFLMEYTQFWLLWETKSNQ